MPEGDLVNEEWFGALGTLGHIACWTGQAGGDREKPQTSLSGLKAYPEEKGGPRRILHSGLGSSRFLACLASIHCSELYSPPSSRAPGRPSNGGTALLA